MSKTFRDNRMPRKYEIGQRVILTEDKNIKVPNGITSVINSSCFNEAYRSEWVIVDWEGVEFDNKICRMDYLLGNYEKTFKPWVPEDFLIPVDDEFSVTESEVIGLIK